MADFGKLLQIKKILMLKIIFYRDLGTLNHLIKIFLQIRILSMWGVEEVDILMP